jgi:hypothetical protein
LLGRLGSPGSIAHFHDTGHAAQQAFADTGGVLPDLRHPIAQVVVKYGQRQCDDKTDARGYKCFGDPHG